MYKYIFIIFEWCKGDRKAFSPHGRDPNSSNTFMTFRLSALLNQTLNPNTIHMQIGLITYNFLNA